MQLRQLLITMEGQYRALDYQLTNLQDYRQFGCNYIFHQLNGQKGSPIK